MNQLMSKLILYTVTLSLIWGLKNFFVDNALDQQKSKPTIEKNQPVNNGLYTIPPQSEK